MADQEQQEQQQQQPEEQPTSAHVVEPNVRWVGDRFQNAKGETVSTEAPRYIQDSLGRLEVPADAHFGFYSAEARRFLNTPGFKLITRKGE